jgi:filamentous hemagglutinin family protein
MKKSAIGLMICLLLCDRQSSIAQVVSDGTLNTTVNSPDGQNFTVEDGNRSGSNLFHSFQEFSIPTGGSALFNNASDVQNIFSRVTGGSISNIDGLIRANGGANLFLINPNGIIFGNSARLDIGGSFIGSTANSVRFADGVEFSAVNPDNSSLLTISIPIGLQFGQNPNAIAVNNQPSLNPSLNPGLFIKPGQRLSLIGGDIILNGGRLTALGGQVELAGLAQSGVISLDQRGILAIT